MRDRLTALLESAESAVYWDSNNKSFIEKIADHLIANNVTIPPVSVGQTVYIMRVPDNMEPRIVPEQVDKIEITLTAGRQRCVFSNNQFWRTSEDIGKTVFLTIEEAEQALKERSDSNDQC